MNVNPEQQALLMAYIADGLTKYEPEVAEAVQAHMEAGRHRFVSNFDYDAAGEIKPDSLRVEYQVCVDDGWTGIVSVHHTRLGMTPEQIDTEVRSAQAQDDMGIFPHPDDPPPMP